MLNSVKIIICIFLLSFPCLLNISQHFQLVLIIIICCSIPAPIPGHSQEWRTLIPFPEFWECFFSFPSRSRTSGMPFFHSLPVPKFWEWDFFIPFPFPKFGKGFFIPFSFPNFGNGLSQFPSRSRTLGMEFSVPVPIFEPSKVIPAHPWAVTKALFNSYQNSIQSIRTL